MSTFSVTSGYYTAPADFAQNLISALLRLSRINTQLSTFPLPMAHGFSGTDQYRRNRRDILTWVFLTCLHQIRRRTDSQWRTSTSNIKHRFGVTTGGLM